MVGFMGTTVVADNINYGDVDDDGVVTATDAAFVMQYVLDNQTSVITADMLQRAKVCGDDNVTSSDASEILQKALNSSFSYSVDKNKAEYYIGQSVTDLPTATKVYYGCRGCDEYIYNTDYTDYVKVSVKDGKVVEINLFAKDFDYLGNKYGATGSVLGGSDSIEVVGYYDTLADNGLFGLSVRDKSFNTVYTYSEAEISAFSDIMFDITNIYRVKYGLTPLQVSEEVSAAADSYCRYMAENKYFAHEDLEGKRVYDRLTDRGVAYNICGENIAYGYDGGIDVIMGWIQSEGHRRNILSDSYTYLGTSVAYNPEDTQYWYTRFIQIFVG